jgi:hypothetical protein
VLQMSVLPSVQPFHAIAYPIDPLLALDIRFVYVTSFLCRINMDTIVSYVLSLYSLIDLFYTCIGCCAAAANMRIIVT